MAAPDNSLLKDVHTLVDQVVEETNQAAGFSKSLPTFAMSDVDGQRYDDVEYLPEDFRFEAQDGYVSKADNTDAQALTDRLIPIRRNKSLYIKTAIKTKELRDPRLREMAVKGFARELRNKADTYAYMKAITSANMVVTSAAGIEQSDASAAEVLMLDAGLGGYASNLHLSLPHYKDLSDKLALNQYHGGLPQTAYERSIIPNQIGGFDKATRADYRLTLGAQAAAGVTVTGAQKHTVATKDANDNYIDNRVMDLTVSATAGLKAGDKFTIAGVNRLNPEVREDTSELMTFTVMAVKSGTVATISPAIIVDGPYRNCSAEAADSAAISFLNIKANNPSVFWAADSIKIIPGNLPVEGGGVDKVDAVTEQGIPMRFTYWYDPDLEVMLMKAVMYFDVEVWLPSQVGIILDKQA
ncbi:MAG: hypothetical protein CMM15_02540 [Rhodospirillaceae bacterium]|nr:hypothetical protein [Rhodospirillaceae bacterium]